MHSVTESVEKRRCRREGRGVVTATDDVCAGHEGGREGEPFLNTVLEKEREKEWKQGRKDGGKRLSPEQVQRAQDIPPACINKHHPAIATLVRARHRGPLSPLPIPAHRH